MSVLNPFAAFAGNLRGVRVKRPTANLPQTAAAALFTITGGKVLVTALFGEVTTVIQAQADLVKLTFDPTDAGATQDLSVSTASDITGDAVGTMYSLTGDATVKLTDSLNFLPANKLPTQPFILKPGAILLDCSASNTGQVKWDIWYVPLDDGAKVVAA